MQKNERECAENYLTVNLSKNSCIFSDRMIIFQHQKNKNQSTEIYTTVKTEFPSLLNARLSKVTPLPSHTAPSTAVCIPEESNTTTPRKKKDLPLLTNN